jgi:hypothetical protein
MHTAVADLLLGPAKGKETQQFGSVHPSTESNENDFPRYGDAGKRNKPRNI